MTTVNNVIITGSGAANQDVDTNRYEYESVFKAMTDLLDFTTPRSLLTNDEIWRFPKHPECPFGDYFCLSAGLPGSTFWDGTNTILRLIPACDADEDHYIELCGMLYWDEVAGWSGYSPYNKQYPIRDYHLRRAGKWSGTGIVRAVSHAAYTKVQDMHIDHVGFAFNAGTRYKSGDTSFDNTKTGSGVRFVANRITARPTLQGANEFAQNFNTGGTLNNDLIIEVKNSIFAANANASMVLGLSTTDRTRAIVEHSALLYYGASTLTGGVLVNRGKGYNCYAGATTADTGSSLGYTLSDLTNCASSNDAGSSGLRRLAIGDVFDGTVSNDFMSLLEDSDAAIQFFPKSSGALAGAGADLTSIGGVTTDLNGTARTVSAPSIGPLEPADDQPTDLGMSDLIDGLDRTRNNVLPLFRGSVFSKGDGFTLTISDEAAGAKTWGGNYGIVHFDEAFNARGQSDGHGSSADNAEYCGPADTRRVIQGDTSYRPINTGDNVDYQSTANPIASHAYINSLGIPGTNDHYAQFNQPNTNAVNASPRSKVHRINIKTGEKVANFDITFGGSADSVGEAGFLPCPLHETMLMFVKDLTTSSGGYELSSLDTATNTPTLRKTGTGPAGLGYTEPMRWIVCNDTIVYVFETSIHIQDITSLSAIGSIVDVTSLATNFDDIESPNRVGWAYNSNTDELACYDGPKFWTILLDVLKGDSDPADFTAIDLLAADDETILLYSRNTGPTAEDNNGVMVYNATYDAYAIHKYSASSDALAPDWVFAPSQAAAAVDVTPSDLAVALSFGAPTLTQVHEVSPADLAFVVTFGTAGLTQVHQVAPSDLAVALQFGTPVLTQAHEVSPEDLAVALQIGTPALGQGFVVQPEDLAVALSLGQPTLAQVHEVTPDDLALALTIGAPGLSQIHSVQPGTMQIAVTLGTPALTDSSIAPPSQRTIYVAPISRNIPVRN